MRYFLKFMTFSATALLFSATAHATLIHSYEFSGNAVNATQNPPLNAATLRPG